MPRVPAMPPLGFSSQAIALLQLMRAISGEQLYVFPSVRHKGSHIQKETANMALKRMGFANRLVVHGMRSLASTVLNEAGFYGDLVESALAHEDKNQVRRAYNKAGYLKGRKDMMQWWSDHIQAAAQGNISLAVVPEYKPAA